MFYLLLNFQKFFANSVNGGMDHTYQFDWIRDDQPINGTSYNTTESLV